MILKVRDEQDFNLTLNQNINYEKGFIELLVTTWDKEAHTKSTRGFSAEKFRDALDYYHQQEVEVFGDKEVSGQKREFYVKTPLGDLHVYAKYENEDMMEDYPGVYVDLVREGHEAEMLTCIEYDSGNGGMLTTAYDIGNDTPVVYHLHEIEDDDEQEKPKCKLMSKEELSDFKEMFGRYCCNERAVGNCDGSTCECCPIQKAYEEVERFSGSDADGDEEDNDEE